ncbi:MAG: aldo/keto reductase [Candidatus Izemoplasmatales bacterium]|nr:aldo/keto reductase [Candidatus Izemoplasmatales bacterium]
MKYNPYGKLNVQASRIGFGGWQLGNTEFWGEMSFEDGVKLVREAFKSGVNLFDTAPGYASGMSEKIIGEALHDVRDKVIINTKLGHKADGTSDFSVDSLESQIKESLSRLQTDYLDSVILHNPDYDILSGKTEHFNELKRLKEKGLINSYGVSIDTYDELKIVIEKTNVEVIEILFNIFFQSPSALFTFVKHKKIALITKVPLDSGWLTGKYDHNAKFEGIRARWDKNTIERRADLIRKMKIMTNDDNLTKYAIAFILSHPGVTSVITGVKNSQQLQENIKAESFEIPYKLRQQFIDIYSQQIKNNPLPW